MKIYFHRMKQYLASSLSMCYCKSQERSSQLLEKYKLVHRGWQRDIVCGDCNQDLGRDKRQG